MCHTRYNYTNAGVYRRFIVIIIINKCMQA